jgi:hypothetical protein
MRSLVIALSLLLTGVWAFGIVDPVPPSEQASAEPSCQQLLSKTEQATLAAQCQSSAEEVTWLNWLTGDSYSMQFHFFDLIELISGAHDRAQKSYAN